MSESLELKDILSFEYVKEHLAEVIVEVEQGEEYKVVTKGSKPAVAFVKAAQYRAVYEKLDELGETARPFSSVVRLGFSIRDILDEPGLTEHFDEIFDDVSDELSQKVLLKNNEQAIVVTNADNYREAEQRLFALEMEQTVKEMMEENDRGELDDLESLAERLGIPLDQNPPKPEGYDQMIPERFRNAS